MKNLINLHSSINTIDKSMNFYLNLQLCYFVAHNVGLSKSNYFTHGQSQILPVSEILSLFQDKKVSLTMRIYFYLIR